MEGWWKFQKSRDNSLAQVAFAIYLQYPSEDKALFHLQCWICTHSHSPFYISQTVIKKHV